MVGTKSELCSWSRIGGKLVVWTLRSGEGPVSAGGTSFVSSLLIRHEDRLGFDAGDGAEFAFGDCSAEFGDAAEVVVRWAAANKFLMQVLAEHVGGIADNWIVVAGTRQPRPLNFKYNPAALRKV